MFLTLLSYFKKLPVRVQQIVGLAAGSFFVIFAVYSVWNQSVADTLVRYAGSQTTVYVHLNYSWWRSSDHFTTVVKKVLKDNGLTDFNFGYLKRELAVICWSPDQKMSCGMIIRTYNPRQLEKYIISKGLKYRFLDLGQSYLAVSADEKWLATVAGQKDTAVKQRLVGSIPLFNSLTVYLSKDFLNSLKSQNVFFDFLPIDQKNGDFVLSGRVTDRGLAFNGAGLSKEDSPSRKFGLFQQFKDWDLVFSSLNSAKILAGWGSNVGSEGKILADNLKTYLQGNFQASSSDTGVNKVFNSPILFLARSNNNQSGYFWTDRQVYLSFQLSQPLIGDEINSLETVLRAVAARKYPKEAKIQLSDGSIIRELKPDIKYFEFIDFQGARKLSVNNDELVIFYKLDGKKLVIANTWELLNKDFAPINYNYLKIKSSWLATWPLVGQYLGLFDYVEAGRDLILE